MTDRDRSLLDELAIRKLTDAYSHAVMRGDGSAAAACYSENGILSAYNAPDVVGRDRIGSILDSTLAPLKFMILTCTNGIVEVAGDTAVASWSVSEWLAVDDGDKLNCNFGVYEDTLVRLDEGWRFTRRRFQVFGRGQVPFSGKFSPRPNLEHDYTVPRFLDPA
ncbi:MULTISPECIES: nuclear transport factor 2 family protein [Rhodococcus]|uniref:Nuclear transport factor 2 family protein n=1 Tax=Rhodococcus chondri TaxID=3065941 RepID=A0ABU7JLD9_9NOCA|nr:MULTISPECIES: nuclear transport factor 2 family protein [unclassified Rhodococcus (in: high G+C Gram-positive bacteria)]MEE2030853.1 nuclear transport factor 2 family protein [Rhodococcus sp. CC-R104]TCN53625.1 SnoaL-like protein [Rhodococcus sp. SMB37]